MSDKAIDFKQRARIACSCMTIALALVAWILPSTAGAAGNAPALDANGVEHFSRNPSGEHPYFACPPATKLEATCQAVVVPAAATPAIRKQRKELGIVGQGATPALEGSGVEGGFSPADLRSAYKLSEAGGKGMTIAITGAFGYPKAESDLKTYRAQFGLPECTTANGCFRKVNQKGEEANYPPQPGPFDGYWDLEAALDLDMASAICPECKILLVQADNNLTVNLGAAVNKAAELGATVISNSWGSDERAKETEEDALYYNHPGIPMLFSSGDSGYGTSYPAASPKVVAVGGTSLFKDKSTRAWHESAWSGAGSGCSAYEKKPEWQTDSGCANRTIADVSAVADPATPVSIYNSRFTEGGPPGWLRLGGTSASAPILAGVMARASETERAKGAKLYWEQGPEAKLFDVAEGFNGTCYPEAAYLCAGRAGYDGPTGWGTPGSVSPGAPMVGTSDASGIGAGKATLNGVVNPNGKSTTYAFRIGTTTAYEKTVGVKTLPAGTSSVEVSVPVTDLTWGTTYHYRLQATGGGGETFGADHTFVASRWSVQENPAKPYQQFFEGVSCTSATFCMTVGFKNVEYERDAYQEELEEVENGELPPGFLGSQYLFGHAVYAERWNGSDWAATSPILPHEIDDHIKNEFTDVSCTSSSFCMALGESYTERKEGEEGQAPFVERWNGSEWTLEPMPMPSDTYVYEKGFRKVFLGTVSCTSSSFCIAAGSYAAKGPSGESTNKKLAESWNGTKWQIMASAPVGEFNEDQELSCTSPTWCMMAGTNHEFTAERFTGITAIWNGSKWTAGASFPNRATTGISCTSSTFCAASAFIPRKESERTGIALTWNGTKWSEQERNGVLKDVSCLSSTWCTMVGFTGGYEVYPEIQHPYVATALRWNGSGWTLEPPAVPAQAVFPQESELKDVSCTSGGCTALGYYGSQGGNNGFSSGADPLTERLTLPPENRTLPVVSAETKYGGLTAYEGVKQVPTMDTWVGETGSYTFQWQRCNASGAECSNISGATAQTYTYTPVTADVGKTLVVAVTANGPAGLNPTTATSKPSGVVVPAGQVNAYPVATGIHPTAITVGPDQKLWYAAAVNKIGKMTTTGAVTEYALPAGSNPRGITSGPDGKVWYTNYESGKISQITTAGAITEYALPAGSKPVGIVTGPDGNLWYTNYEGKIGKITTAGAITEYALTSGRKPTEITVGPDGNIWFVDAINAKVGKITTAGAVTEYAVPSGSSPTGITSGPDGNLWITLFGNNRVAKVTTAGTFTEYPLPFTASLPEDIATGPDGNLWVTEWGGHNKIARVTPSGTVTEYSVPAGMLGMRGIVFGPDNRMWFTAERSEGKGTDEIGAMVP
jgi:streptogramin lyase